ncbi:MAG: TonB-dependent receptor [Gammaproteobacteria bacterium]|nr:TonB-dependent receptor [Gammaproteobacteria bacterium]
MKTRNSGAALAIASGAVVLCSTYDLRAQEREDDHHTLDEITVTAAPLSRTVEQLAQPTQVLSGAELAKKQAASIGETVSQEPGVSSTYFGPVASRPVIRGQFGERVRVLSNGLDALDVSALSEDHQVSLDSILSERIEIVRGPATLLYGSGAAGGLVNVVDTRITNRPLAKPLSGAFSAGFDSAIGERAAAFRVEAGTDLLAVHVDYFGRRTDDVSIPGFAESALQRALEEAEEEEGRDEEEAFGRIENTDSETDGGALGISITGDSGFIGASLSTFNSDYGVPGHAHEHEEEGEDEEGEEIVRIDLEQVRVDVRGEYNFDAPLNHVNFRFASNDYEHTELEGDEIGTVFETMGTDARVEVHHEPWGSFEGAFGVQYKHNEFDAIGDEAFVPSSDTTRTSLFFFEEFVANPNWLFQASARAERQEIDVGLPVTDYSDTALGASIGAVWTLTDGTSIAANLVLTERHPTSTELYADGAHVAANRVERGSVTTGNGILDKEVSTNLDLTYRGEAGRLEWALTAFLNSVDDYILLSPTAQVEDGFQVFEYRQDDVDFYGFEGELRIELFDAPSGHWHTRMFSDFVYAEESGSGAYLPRIPPWRFGAGLHYSWRALESGLEVVYHDGQTRTAANELPTDSYAIVNIDLSWTFGSNNSVVFLRGKNLGDREARQHTSPLKDLAPLPGRSLQLGLRYWF